MTHRITLLMLAALFVPGAQAQDQTLTVRDAIDLAIASNPELAIEKRAADRARALRWNALGTTGLELDYTREGIPDGAAGFGEQKWAAGLTLPFPLHGTYQWRAANRLAEAGALGGSAALLDVKAAVKEAYTRLLFAQEMVHLRQQEVDLATTLVQVVSARVEVGESAQVDLLKVELEQSSATNALRDAELLFQNSRYTLFQVIGVDPEEQRYEIVFPDTLVYRAFDIDQDRVMGALPEHPASAAARARVASNDLSLKGNTWALLPDLYAGWLQQDFGTGYRFHGLEVGLRMGIPGLDSRRSRLEQARMDAADSRERAFRMDLDLKREAESAWHGFEATREAVRSYTTEQNQRAQNLLQLTREGYQLGQLDLLTVLDAQRVYLDVQRTYYQQLRDYYLQIIQLERLMGDELVFASDEEVQP